MLHNHLYSCQVFGYWTFVHKLEYVIGIDQGFSTCGTWAQEGPKKNWIESKKIAINVDFLR